MQQCDSDDSEKSEKPWDLSRGKAGKLPWALLASIASTRPRLAQRWPTNFNQVSSLLVLDEIRAPQIVEAYNPGIG